MPFEGRRPGRDEVELLERARTTSIDAAVQQLRMLHELKQQRHDKAERATPRRRAPATTKGLEDFTFDLARLSVNHYDQWLRLTEKHFPDIVTVIRQLTGRPAPDLPTPAPLQLSASGTVRSKATSDPFCIENPFDKEVVLSFSAFEMRGHADHRKQAEPFHVHAVFVRLDKRGKPTQDQIRAGDRWELAAQAKAQLHAQLELGAPFAPGTYQGSGRLLSNGRSAALLQLELTVKAK